MTLFKNSLLVSFALAAGLTLPQTSLAQSGQPVLECPTSSCNVLICGGGICTMYSCNSTGCRIVATWRDPAFAEKRQSESPPSARMSPSTNHLTESLVLGPQRRRSETLFSFEGSAPLGVKVCSDRSCGAFVLHNGSVQKVGEAANLNSELRRATSAGGSANR